MLYCSLELNILIIFNSNISKAKETSSSVAWLSSLKSLGEELIKEYEVNFMIFGWSKPQGLSLPSSTLNCGSLWCIYVSMHFFTLTPQTLPNCMCLQMQRLQIQTDLQVCICSLKVCRHTLLNSLGIFNCSMLFNLPLTNCLKPRLSHWFLILVVYVFTGCQPRGSEGGLQSTLDENHHHLCVCVHARVHMYFLKVILKAFIVVMWSHKLNLIQVNIT